MSNAIWKMHLPAVSLHSNQHIQKDTKKKQSKNLCEPGRRILFNASSKSAGLVHFCERESLFVAAV